MEQWRMQMREEDVFEMQSAESERVDMLDTRGKSMNDWLIATSDAAVQSKVQRKHRTELMVQSEVQAAR